jgi:[NiFe] hydrogenase assembly HybE family chaperone
LPTSEPTSGAPPIMSRNVRKAAFQAPQPPPAEPIAVDPTPLLETMYQRIWATSMRDLPFINPALSVEAVGFRRWQSLTASPLADDNSLQASGGPARWSRPSAQGDWVGALVTPWFINLFVLPGGGNLWSDRPPGARCHIEFPIGPLEFIADHDGSAEIPAYQYCPLFAPPGQFASQTAARAAALAALAALFSNPSPADTVPPKSTVTKTGASRRAFFRRIAKG